MPKGRLVFDGDNIYTEKNARVYKLKQEISSRIDAIPGVIDDLNSTSTTDALSANMGRELQDQISALSGNFHFLSTWDCTTGLPGTNPVEDPYNYESGDYYIVSMVAGSGGTNYKPQGGSYVQGVPSTAVETGTVNLSDWYVYDGATWILQPAGSWHIIVDNQLDATSTNPVQNRIITQALANKQNTITNLSTIESGAAAGATALQPGDNISSLTNNSGYQTAGDVAAALGDVIHTGATAPSNPTEGQLWYDTTNDVLKVYDGTQWNVVGVNGSDVNTKTFPLSGTTGATALAEAQAIYDWYVAGKNPLILYNEQIYLFYSELTNSISFITPHNQRSDLGTTSFIMQRTLTLTLSSDTVSGITAGDTMIQGLLMTGYDYPTPYVPEYDGSPSNKKYVDDKVRSAISVIATAPSTPTEGMLWYDTTNDVLKVYDGTNWNTVGGGAYSAGNNIDITNNTISVENAIVTDNTNDTGFRIEGSGGEYYDNTSISSVVLGYEPDEHQNGQLSFDVSSGIINTAYTENAQGTTYESTRLAIDNYAIDVEYEYDNGGGDAGVFSEHYTWLGDGPTGSSTDKIAKLGDIQNVISSGTTSPSSPEEGQLWYDTTNHVLKIYNGTAWVTVDTDTNTTYTAGEGIAILNGDDYSAMRGPCPEGFHVPTINEFQNVYTILVTNLGLASNGNTMANYLKMPLVSERDAIYPGSAPYTPSSRGCYWSSEGKDNDAFGYYMNFDSGNITVQNQRYRTFGLSVRPFKDTQVIPDNNWTVLYQGTGASGIYHNTTLGLISISGDGITRKTIADKNLGATIVYNSGDTMSENNCGKFYQRGNNYGFPYSGNLTTSSTKVDTTGYGPGNYYSSSTYITGYQNRSSIQNDNLWGGVTGVVQLHNAITNTAINENVFVTQTEYNNLPSSKLTDGKTYFIYSAS